MYSLVLMAALTTGDTAPHFFFKNPHAYGGCYGCSGCCGGMPVGCCGGMPVGCTGCYGGAVVGGCTGCYGCTGGLSGPIYGGCTGLGHGYGYGYYGTCDGGCWGVGNSWMNTIPALPPLPVPKSDEDKKEPEKLTEPPKEKDPEKDPEQLNDPKKEKEAALPKNRARVVVALPADARLFIDDQPTKATSSVRTFRTPELQDDQTYYYLLRAEFEVDGKPVVLTKRLVLKAGEEVHARFEDPRPVTVARQR